MIGVLDAPRIVDVPSEAQPMKLSEAIREGAKLRPQCRENYFSDEGSCALGAAMEAITGSASRSAMSVCDLSDKYLTHFDHPASDRRAELFTIIVQLNDDFRWTREQIADWVAEQGL